MSDINNQNGERGPVKSLASTDDLRNRLIEQGLEEILTNETPPDLSERILTTLASTDATISSNHNSSPSHVWTKRVAVFGVVAATLVFVANVVPTLLDVRRRNAAANSTRNVTLALYDRETSLGDGFSTNTVSPADSRLSQDSSGFVDIGPSDASTNGAAAVLDVDSKVSDLSSSIVEEEAPNSGESRLQMMVYPRAITNDPPEPPLASSSLTNVPVRVVPVDEGAVTYTVEPSNQPRRPDSTRFSLGVSGKDYQTYSPSPHSGIAEQTERDRADFLFGDETELNEEVLNKTELATVEKGLGAPGASESFYEIRDASDHFGIELDLEATGQQLAAGRGESVFRRRELESKLQRAELLWQDSQNVEPHNGDRYARIHDNPFIAAKGTDAVSTFSIDVDTASYTNVRQFIMNDGQLPPPDAVRIEELVNYFDYDYAPPKNDAADDDATPFAAHVEVARCPWRPQHRLVRVGLKGKVIDSDKRPLSNLVFLVDVSGSMNETNKLPLVVDGLKHMTRELSENDRVAIVVYASSEGLVLPSTSGTDQQSILSALDNLRAGGSTAGGAGIELAYKIAEDNFIQGGTNRVILCTDGDFNVGVSNTDELQRLAEQKASETKVFLTVLGFGRGNLNDEMMEAISNKGNGNYHYIDNLREARRVLVDQMSGTLVTIAKDVKIQVEFNPAKVASYRLIGYENRILTREDFNDDTKDAGEIGAGHTVTAIYQVCPVGSEVEATKPVSAEPLKYQQSVSDSNALASPVDIDADTTLTDAAQSDELLTLRLRYKLPASDTSTKLEFPIKDSDKSFSAASGDFKFAASVAGFGMLMRNSEHAGNATLDSMVELAEQGIGTDSHGYRAEFIEIINRAKSLSQRAGR